MQQIITVFLINIVRSLASIKIIFKKKNRVDGGKRKREMDNLGGKDRLGKREKRGEKKNCIKRVTSNVLTQSGKSGLSQTCEQVLQQRVGVLV